MIRYYPFGFRVWAAGFLISPSIIAAVDYFTHPDALYRSELISYLLLFVIFGAVMSIPSLLLLWAITYVLTKGYLTQLKIKLTLTIVGVLLTCLPFCLFLGGFYFDINNEGTQIEIVYSVVIVASVWIFKLEYPETKTQVP